MTGASTAGTRRGTLAALWHSPTATTFGSLLARSLSLVVLLPLVLVRLSTEEIALWYLFAAIASLQLLMDLGFNPTFVRATAYTMGGASAAALQAPAAGTRASADWTALQQVWGTMHYIYQRLGALWLVALATFGTLAVTRPIGLAANPDSAWLAWTVVVGVSSISLGCSAFVTFLAGIDEVATLRRWEMVTSVGATLTGAATLLAGGDLLALTLGYHAWSLAGVLGNRRRALNALGGRARQYGGAQRHAAVLAQLWPQAWRTAIGVLTGFALMQLSGVLFAQTASAAAAATYLMALRLIQAVSQFSQAPFYSRLPALARLYSEGRREEVLEIARRGMRLAYATFVAGFLGLAFAGDPLLRLIGSRAAFPDPWLWTLLGLAIFAERYGAMHLNLYSTTNRIVNHIANGGAALLCLAVAGASYRPLGVYAFPVGLLAANVGFYAWYAASRSYAAFSLRPWAFERGVLAVPLIILLAYVAGLTTFHLS